MTDNDEIPFEDPPATVPSLEEPEPGVLRRIADLPRWAKVTISIGVVVAVLGFVIRVPYYSLGPGPTRDMISSIKVTGTKTYPSRGKLLLTTASVSERTLTLWETLWVGLDPALKLYPEESLVEPGTPDEEADAGNVAAMAQSKVEAELAAFAALGCKATRVPGAVVQSVVEGGPSDGKLKQDDLITAIDGVRIRDVSRVGAQLERVRPGTTVRIDVRRGGKTVPVHVRTGASREDRRKAYLGIFMGTSYRLPFEVEFDTARIVGPSGGLVFALALADILSPEDLTGGHVIGVTGTIDANGSVGPIGAVAEKVRGAYATGADVFIVPAAETAEAKAVAPTSMRVIGAATLSDAVKALSDGGTERRPSICR